MLSRFKCIFTGLETCASNGRQDFCSFLLSAVQSSSGAKMIVITGFIFKEDTEKGCSQGKIRCNDL